MAYTKTNWENLPSTNTPINATNLNKMENGIVPSNTQNITASTVNLNDYKTDGIYYFAGTNQTITNIPIGINGWLRVIAPNSSTVKQIWYRHGTANSNDYETYVRTYTSETWSNWTKFFTNKNIVGTPTYNSTYFSSVVRNSYVRNGNIVQLTFIGYTSQSIPNGTTILSNIPTNAIAGLRTVTYTGNEYIKTEIGGNAYFFGNATELKSFGESASKWVHIDLTYITLG